MNLKRFTMRKIIKPPYFAEDAIPTKYGWRLGRDIIERRPLSEKEISDYLEFVDENKPEDLYKGMTKSDLFETYGVSKNQTRDKMIEEIVNGIQ